MSPRRPLFSSPRHSRFVRGGLSCFVAILALSSQVVTSSSASQSRDGAASYKALAPVFTQMNQISRAQGVQTLSAGLQSQLATLSTSNYFKNCTDTSGPKLCQYGDPHGKATLVIMGDSLAMQWVPALNALGTKMHFKVIGYMLGGCNIASALVSSLAFKKLIPECTTFRRAAIAAVNKLNPQPSLVILSEARYELWPNGSSVTNAQWASAIALTLHDIRSSQKSVMIGDPEWRMSPTSCLGVHPSNVAKCALPVAKVLTPTQAGYDGVVAGGAYALGVTLLMCAATCPAISSDSFTHADQWHITEKYSAESADALGALIGCGFYDGLTNVIVKDLLAAPSAAKKAACDQYIGARGWPN